MKSRVLPVFVLFFCCAGLLFPLDKGTLTINNCPAEVSVIICKNNIPKTMMEFANLLMYDRIAYGNGDSSPFTSRTYSGKDFTKTGKFVVIVTDKSVEDEQVIYFVENVSFNKGSATIDFKTMKAYKSLPLF